MLTVDGALPEMWADPDKVDQIIGNLVENALKYGAGTVTVAITGNATASQMRRSSCMKIFGATTYPPSPWTGSRITVATAEGSTCVVSAWSNAEYRGLHRNASPSRGAIASIRSGSGQLRRDSARMRCRSPDHVPKSSLA